MLDELERYREIAARMQMTEDNVRHLAMSPNWPPAEVRIGTVLFFERGAVDLFFENRTDRRNFNGRKKKRRK